MYLCYIDESGTASIPGNTSHYVLAGLSIPVWHWKDCEDEINTVKRKFALENNEIHVAWVLRSYREQDQISNFKDLDFDHRRYEVDKLRKTEILRLQNSKNRALHLQTKKNYRKTNAYVHLTLDERKLLVEELAKKVSSWGFARLFAECIDKIHFNPAIAPISLDEQALEQVVSRFEHYLRLTESASSSSTKSGGTPSGTPVFGTAQKPLGLLIHDNNPTVALRHTSLVKSFHRVGTFWTNLDHIIETPLFVNSELTSMVQNADLCSYSLRRYLENSESKLFDHVFKRAHRKASTAVGVRHFTSTLCSCKICSSHRIVSGPSLNPGSPVPHQP